MAGRLNAVSGDILHVLENGCELVTDIVQEDLAAFVDLLDFGVTEDHFLEVEEVGLQELLKLFLAGLETGLDVFAYS